MMGGFRLQMAHELSCGVLYALQSDRSSCVSITIDDSHSGIQDDTAKHGQSDCDDMEIDQTDQLGDDGDMDDEVMLMKIDSALVFQSTLNPLKVLEIFHYLMEMKVMLS
eukprot:Em0140g9a